MDTPLSFQDIKDAHNRIRPFINQTPVLTSNSLNAWVGAELFLKCENLQKIGAFKIRGATNAALCLSAEEKKNGIATHSSGNHAQAIALAAQNVGVKAYVVMPDNSPTVKVNAVRGYGAEIIFCTPDISARETTLDKVIKDTGAAFIHPFNNYRIIAGQATASKELLEEVRKLDALIAPIGGGGLMSGTCLTVHYLSPSVSVFGSEPKAVDDAYRSWKSGTLQKNETTKSIADGLLTNLGDKTFAIIKDHVKDIFTVSEEEIVAAMHFVWERMKIIIEPSSAVAIAAVKQQKEVFQNMKVGVIITGGNVDLAKLPFK
ncbi:MAG TPA: threonine/serine dehydratase [Flavobacteriales bacterium]|nr:threonine/serine dehydratase [Flavobacteriales bacterium]